MSRKPKISSEQKIKAIKAYLKGTDTATNLSNYLGIERCTFHRMINKYKVNGEFGFNDSRKNTLITKEEKSNAIQDYLDGKGSYEDITNKYNFRSSSMLKAWIKKYNKGIENKEYNPKGDVYMNKTRKVTYEEKVEIVNWVLVHNNEYKLAAEEFNTSYSQVYNWVKKYLELGEDGLRDNRGKNKPIEKLSETDKLKRDLDILRRKNERLEMENEVLKKVQEIERGDQLARLGKKPNINR